MSRALQNLERVRVTFDDDNLVADAGLLLPATLVERLGVASLINATVRLDGRVGALVVDVDSTIYEVVGNAKEGASYGYAHVLGCHPLLAPVATTLTRLDVRYTMAIKTGVSPVRTAIANPVWFQIAILAHNMCRWTTRLGGHDTDRLIVARTIRTRFVALPGRLVNRAGQPTLRLPTRWPWAHAFALDALRALEPVPSRHPRDEPRPVDRG